MSTTTPREQVDEMTEAEKDRLLKRVADSVDDEAVSRICELAVGAYSSEETTS